MKTQSRLVVAVSSRALFDYEDAHRVFESDGLAAYLDHQINSTADPQQGAAFPIVKALSNFAKSAKAPIEVVVISRNNPTVGLKIVQAIERAGLGAARGVFTGGAPSLVPHLRAFGAQLFLTKDPKDAASAVAAGIPAALMLDPISGFDPDFDVVRIAFDGDSCLFSNESDKIYDEKGLQAFMDHEHEHAARPLPPGPLAPFLTAIKRFQDATTGKKLFRIALVTARIGKARARALATLQTWGIEVDEAYFLGHDPKSKFLEVFSPHIFFDDKLENLSLASKVVPSAQVLPGQISAELIPSAAAEADVLGDDEAARLPAP